MGAKGTEKVVARHFSAATNTPAGRDARDVPRRDATGLGARGAGRTRRRVLPVGGAENGDAGKKTASQAAAWGGQADQAFDRCYHQACDRIDNVNREVLDHYLRAIAGTVAHFATSTDDLS